MRARLTTALAAAALTAFAACSSGGGVRKPAPVRNYGPEAGRVASSTPGTPTPPAAGVSGPYRWNNRLADAQAQARASGKLILVASTKPGCTLCEKFKNQIVPSVAGEAGAMSVGYTYDITRPEVRQVDQILRANLPGASLMPLVGFLTADLQWVHGFWGARTTQEFRGDMGSASRLNPRRSAQAAPMRTVGDTRTAIAAVTNEYGESEWIPAGDVWPAGADPEPIDAITGTPAPTAPGGAFDRTGAASALADAPAASTNNPPLDPAPGSAPLAPPPPSAGVVADTGFVDAPSAPGPGPTDRIADAAVPASRPAAAERRWSEPVQTRAAASVGSPSLTPEEAWGRDALARALGQIEGARYDAARATLREIEARMPDTTLAREASKGSIALYNAKRIQTAASEAERDRFLHRARRDLGSSMWGGLFSS